MRFPRPKSGDLISPELFTALYDAIDRGPQVVAPLTVTKDGAIGLDAAPGFWIALTGAPSGAKHPWKRVVPRAGGTWIDGTGSGSTTDDPAYEINGSTANLNGKRARAWRDRTSGLVLFAYSTCS